MERLKELIDLLGISEDESMRALLSAFASIQPGPMRQGFLRCSEYGVAPDTRTIWHMLVDSQFRCAECGTHYDLTMDHINRDRKNIDQSNLRIVCRDHNRAANSRGLANKNANLRIYCAIMSLWKRNGRFPSDVEIQTEAGVSQISGSRYMIRFFQLKILGEMTPLGPYLRRERPNQAMQRTVPRSDA